ncbi:MAG: hypothetical protein WC233_06715 [Sphaerochaeta sp.]|jgi:hypothetical protein
MHHHRLRAICIAVLISLIISPLAALPLSTIVERALVESPRMQDLELSKRDTLLTIGLNQAEDGVGISIKGGVSTSLDLDKPSSTISTNLSSTITLPNDGKTSIVVSTGGVVYNTDKKTYSFSPSVEASHTITYGLTTDNLKSLTNRQTDIMANSAYESSRITFTNSLYTQIATLLESERNIKRTTKEIADLRRTLDQNLQLQLIREGSLTHRATTQAIKSKETALEGLLEADALYLRQFENLAGFAWEGVEEITEPNLLFEPEKIKNSNLELKSLAVELAREDLALELAKHTNKNLVVGGSLTYDGAKGEITPLGKPTEIVYGNELTTTGSVNLTSKQFGLSGKVTAAYDFESNKFTPSLTIGGSWSNNPSSASDMLTYQQKENSVLSAELALRTATDEFNQSVMSLQNDIAAYLMNYAMVLETMEYNEETLAQQKELFAKGLISQREVDDAQFVVDLDHYTLQATLLQGLRLQNQIKSLGI